MDVYLLGAGASKAFVTSKTDEKLPLANDFFSTFNKLDISGNGWVLIGDLINYVQEKHGVSVIDFDTFNEDIESLHSEIQEDYLNAIKADDYPNIIHYGKAFNQLVFLFCSVINEIQNGDESEFHNNLVNGLNEDDTIITFNWDTLIDKALRDNSSWSLKNGYYVIPEKIYQDGWKTGEKSKNKNLLLKLHGSSNWISSYITYDRTTKTIEFQHEGPKDMLYVYENTLKPYSCYDGRYMEGYNDFSMGYYPPNIPTNNYRQEIPEGHSGMQAIFRNGINPKGKSSSDGIVSMPVIIPPVKNKSYDFYGNLFPALWEKAEDALQQAQTIYVLGYSFPLTDIPSSELFKKAFLRRDSIPKIVIVNPDPEQIVQKFKLDFGIIEDNVKVYPEFITSDYVINKEI